MQIYARTLGIWFSGMNAKQGLLLFSCSGRATAPVVPAASGGATAASVSNNSIMEIVVDWSGNDDDGKRISLIVKKIKSYERKKTQTEKKSLKKTSKK